MSRRRRNSKRSTTRAAVVPGVIAGAQPSPSKARPLGFRQALRMLSNLVPDIPLRDAVVLGAVAVDVLQGRPKLPLARLAAGLLCEPGDQQKVEAMADPVTKPGEQLELKQDKPT